MRGRSVRSSRVAGVWAVALCVVAACKQPAAADAARASSSSATATEPAPPVPFEVRRDSADLTFFWFDARGNAHAVTRVDEVPAASRDNVRVDPSRPELRAPGWVYIADLRAPGSDGRYGVRAVQSEQFANELAALNGLAQAMAPPSEPGAGAHPSGAVANGAPHAGAQQPHIVIYGASWCSACHQAAAFLRANNIPFVERDIEREPDAAQEMLARAREQGVPTGSIPIIDVNGRLMVGFNPDALQAAIHGS